HGLLLVDPHRDLARATLARVPPERRGDVVYLDAGDMVRPFGLNLIDAGLGWRRDQAVESTLDVFRRQFEGFWGPRMSNVFRWALATLFEVNRKICLADPDGRARQHTIFSGPAVPTSAPLRH